MTPIPSTEIRERRETGTIDLPWPSTSLSPNARVHWHQKANAAKNARAVARFMTTMRIGKQPWDRVAVSVVFCPPDKRSRDIDNLIASMKAATDGIADALGVDDSRFDCTYAIGEVVKGGEVRVAVAEVVA